MDCNEDGRCWRQRRERRVVIRGGRDAYGYARRERYIERRGYEDHGGIGFRTPGVSVEVGGDRYRGMTRYPMKKAAEQSAAFSFGRILKRHRSNASVGVCCDLSRLSRARDVRPSQPFRKPKRSNRS